MVWFFLLSSRAGDAPVDPELIYDLLTIGYKTLGSPSDFDGWGGPWRMGNTEIADVRMDVNDDGDTVFKLVRYAADGMSVSSSLKSNTTTQLADDTVFPKLVMAANSDVTQIGASTNRTVAIWDMTQGAFMAADFPTSAAAFYMNWLDAHDFGDIYDSVLAVVRTTNTLIYGRVDDQLNLLSTLSDSVLTFNSDPEAMCLMADGIWGIEPVTTTSTYQLKAQRFDANGWSATYETGVFSTTFGEPSNFKLLALDPLNYFGLVSWCETSGSDIEFFVRIFSFDVEGDGFVEYSDTLELGERPDEQWPNDIHWVRIDEDSAAFTRYTGTQDYYTEIVLADTTLAISHDDPIPEDTGIPNSGGGIEGTSKTWDEGLLLQTDRDGLRVIQVYREVGDGDNWVWDPEAIASLEHSADAYAYVAYKAGPFVMADGSVVYGYPETSGGSEKFRLSKLAADGSSETSSVASSTFTLSFVGSNPDVYGALSPDKKLMAIVAGDHLGVYDQDTGAWRVLDLGGAGVSWSAIQSIEFLNDANLLTTGTVETVKYDPGAPSITVIDSYASASGKASLARVLSGVGRLYQTAGTGSFTLKSKVFGGLSWSSEVVGPVITGLNSGTNLRCFSMNEDDSIVMATWSDASSGNKRWFKVLEMSAGALTSKSNEVEIDDSSVTNVTAEVGMARIDDTRMVYVYGTSGSGNRLVELTWDGASTLTATEDADPVNIVSGLTDTFGALSRSAGFNEATGRMFAIDASGVRTYRVYTET